MLGTYVSLALILGASFVVGQAVFCACGHRERSPLAPAVGLGLLCAVAWLAAELASSAWAGLGAMFVVTVVGATLLRFEPATGDWGDALPVAIGAVVLGSLPFVIEMRFGILGTGLNPDMSQHLFATDRITSGGEERLIAEGYPLGPHAVVASIAELGPSFVQAFNGLMLATAVAAALAPLGVLRDLERTRRIAVALLAGVAYLMASYFIQGAFKETMQALFVLAFAVGLAEVAAGATATESRWERLKGLPLAAIAVGSLYAYSFPGLTWLVGALGVFAVAEVVRARGLWGVREAIVPGLIAVVAVGVVAAPEVPRMLDFASFETFDPDGAGLGNLFNPISPIEALGIWPSGDFRLDPGAGFAPAFAFYVGGAIGALALGLGLVRALQAGETALASALAAGAVLYVYALVAGTPYQEAKALAIVAPLAMLIAARGCLEETPHLHTLRTCARPPARPARPDPRVPGRSGWLERARARERPGRPVHLDAGAPRVLRPNCRGRADPGGGRRRDGRSERARSRHLGASRARSLRDLPRGGLGRDRVG